jgi:aryl-alcohol dehydrogenase-like predicted oxidoreductase
MRYRLLGNSGLRVSELCLETMTFNSTHRPPQPPVPGPQIPLACARSRACDRTTGAPKRGQNRREATARS